MNRTGAQLAAGAHGRGVETRGDTEAPRLRVVIEVPKGGFLKRGYTEEVDFVSPFPCPFNYGAVHDYVGSDNDLLDAVVLGPRLPRNARVEVTAYGAIGLSDRGLYDDKLICATQPPGRLARTLVVAFFHFYALCKRLLNIYRGRPGRTACEGWGDARAAIARARPRASAAWSGPTVPY